MIGITFLSKTILQNEARLTGQHRHIRLADSRQRRTYQRSYAVFVTVILAFL
jgi:hypothetical protein